MAKNTSEIINGFRKKIPDLSEEDLEDLLSNLSLRWHLGSRDRLHVLEAKTYQEKLERFLNGRVKEGVGACEKLVNHLQELSSTFPALSDLFPGSALCAKIRPCVPPKPKKLPTLPRASGPREPGRTKLPTSRVVSCPGVISALNTSIQSAKTADPRDMDPPGVNRICDEILRRLGMKKYKKSKMTVSNILTIGRDSLKDIELRTIEDAPWYFLRKLMSLNVNARRTHIEESESDLNIEFLNPSSESTDQEHSGDLHPLDVLCILLHCSDSFLQQEIVTKLSMCQFAVPLLLPACSGSECTYMLWALRDIVKKWRPHSLEDRNNFSEDNVVNIQMPVFSFVRLEDCRLSKSAILNQILTPPQQYHNFFIHRDMEGGNVKKKLSNGLVEMFWYLPVGQENSDIFPEPIAVTNLHGHISSYWTQFSFLTQISSAVFIFADSVSETECMQLSKLGDANSKYFFVSQNLEINNSMLQSLNSALNIDDGHFIQKKNRNDAALARQLQNIMKAFIKKPTKQVTLEKMAETACELGIHVDELSKECQSAKNRALKITKRIYDVAGYKKETMKLQGDLCKELARTRTEICRMRRQGEEDSQLYREKLENRRIELIRQQYSHTPSAGIVAFTEAISQKNHSERCYFLKWMKILLDSIARTNLLKLQNEYKAKDSSDIKQLDLTMSKSSLGVEHFIRELGQFYDAECNLLKNNEIPNGERIFNKLPEIAADLLLDGLPLELIDGDSSSIPLEWITNVLSELDKKTGGQCRIRVITVLGVQSTGKSTLLNTMFGLQFPVASGRCTKGAFMTLIKIEENFQQELGCSFILVLDTEGLKAPEMSSLDGSDQRDNELATLVVGLSDITIINISMENAAEMKDILQIVVHAFLRMETIGKKPKYYFLHQNVSDVAASAQCLRDRRKIIDDLDEMTRTAAKMAKKNGIKSFSDVLDADHENHSWYIPGLWHGVPPMSSVSTGYSNKVYEFKKYLLQVMKTSERQAQSWSEFSKWIRSLWEAVQYENFIFNFRNSLVADAYDQLHVKYNELKWKFSKVMFKWMQETENIIRNQPNSQKELSADAINNMYEILQSEEKSIREALERYFDGGSENANAHLIERYREEFLRSVSSLRKQLEDDVKQRLNEYWQIQRGKAMIQTNQNTFMEVIEKKAASKYQTLKNCEVLLNHDEEFEKIWNETFMEIKVISLHIRNIGQEILHQLRTDMKHSIGAVTMKLHNIHNLKDYEKKCFAAQPHHFDASWYNTASKTISNKYPDNRQVQMNKYVDALLLSCKQYVTAKMNTKEDYHDTYCQELLNMVNEKLQQSTVQKLHISPQFELDLKLHVLGRAAPMFQKMHEDFIQENDPRISLEKLKPQYLATFRNIFLEKDQCKKRAEVFCCSCLKPAIVEFIYKNLGREIVDDILLSKHSKEYSSRMFFQFNLLKKLLELKDFDHYMMYINDYEAFVKSMLQADIVDNYGKPGGLKNLHEKIIHKITHVVNNALKDPTVQESTNVSSFLEMFCKLLQKELVIPRNAMNVILFQNNDKAQQFSEYIQSSFSKQVDEILKEMNSLDIDYVLSMVTLNPLDQLFKRIFGCGKLCPFCKVPCEAGGHDHTEHFASVHRPQGLAGYKELATNVLCNSICSTDVVGNGCFRNSYTQWVPERYKEYRKFYPDWVIQSDPGINASVYWKFILKEFNDQLAEEFNAIPAKIPINWEKITKEQAMKSLRDSFNL
ncbi:interferon-induced very large GTPase 1-like isoform X1 [Aquarana catesbeiana]|uniref:interferon-induced very large GTPase 1-like isoform X1 n=2 Tax=Aquarana catesbeiana TaxID=8400 RepID=UPI003CCA1550